MTWRPSFMHITDWDRYGYILEAMRVLRPRGRMYVDNLNLLTDEGWAAFEQSRAVPTGARPFRPQPVLNPTGA